MQKVTSIWMPLLLRPLNPQPSSWLELGLTFNITSNWQDKMQEEETTKWRTVTKTVLSLKNGKSCCTNSGKRSGTGVLDVPRELGTL